MPRGKYQKTREHREHISAALKAKGIRPHCKHDAEWRKKVSQALKRYYSIPENRQRLDAIRRKRWDNPQNRGGIVYWRNKLIEENGQVCGLCNRQVEHIELHHKDRNRSNNSRENLILLCRSCHAKVHARDGNWLQPVFRALEEALNKIGGTEEDKDYLYTVIVKSICLQYGLYG